MRINRLLSVLLCVCLLLPLTACKDKTADQLFKYDIATEPISLDPQLANDYASELVLLNMMEGLLRINTQGKLTEGVAQNYTVSENGRVYTFALRTDAKWENGDPVTAHDFVFAFRRLLDPATNAPKANQFYAIRNAKKVHKGRLSTDRLGVQAKDAYTLEITLVNRNSMFLQLLTGAAAMPCNEKFFYETKGKYGLDADKTLSNGAFMLNSWAHDDYLALKRNPNYTSARAVIPSGVSFIIEPEAAEHRFTTDQTDILLKSEAQALIDADKYAVEVYENTVWGIAFNLADKVLKNDDIRKALVKAFDVKSYGGALPMYFEQMGAIVPPTVTMLDASYRAYAGTDIVPEYDPKEAKRLLKKGKKKVGKKSLNHLTLIAPEGMPHLEIFAYASQVWQKELGVYIAVKSLPLDEYQSRLETKDFDCALISLSAEYNSPSSILSAFRSDSKQNFYGYRSTTYDRLLDGAEGAADLSEAASYYKTAERRLLNDGVLIPMYMQKEYFLKHEGVDGITYYPVNKLIDFAEGRKK